MRIFLDTANIDEIRQAARLGIVTGVTTNPSLVAKENRASLKEVIQEIASIIAGPISAEVLSSQSSAMIEEARQITTWSPSVVVKIPLSVAGLEALAVLSKEGIKSNLTLCFSLNQAILGALAGATFISPFVGRLDDVGQDGMELVATVVETYAHYQFPTQVIAASIRHPLHCVAAARAGAHVATMPYRVLMQMFQHPLTEAGISRFAEDGRSVAKG